VSAAPPDKVCARCGRPFAWRKKWARDWEQVKFCSDACRRGAGQVGASIDTAMMVALDGRAQGSSICPSEVARAIDPKRWRERLDDVRAAAVRLALAKRIVVLQAGCVVDPLAIDVTQGAIRIRKA
jgi:hypothetical protein